MNWNANKSMDELIDIWMKLSPVLFEVNFRRNSITGQIELVAYGVLK